MKNNTLCRQVAILLPKYGNLLDVSFVERFHIYALFFLLSALVFSTFRLIDQNQGPGLKKPSALPLRSVRKLKSSSKKKKTVDNCMCYLVGVRGT